LISRKQASAARITRHAELLDVRNAFVEMKIRKILDSRPDFG